MTASLLNRIVKILVARKDKPLPEVLEYRESAGFNNSQTESFPEGLKLHQNGNKESAQKKEPVVCSVLDMRAGEKGKVLFITPHQNGRLERLTALGIVPGNAIYLLQKQPSLVVRVDHTEIALDREIAGGIFIRNKGE